MPVRYKVGEAVMSGTTNVRGFPSDGGIGGREHVCRHRSPGRSRAAFASTDVAPGGSIRHRVSGGDRRARGRSLGLERDPIRAVAVLVVATPCPLILAVPVAIVSGPLAPPSTAF